MPTASQNSSLPKGWLPEDVVRNIAAYLSEPLDLYRASKVNRTWRSAIITSNSWEFAYWQIYRPRLDNNDEQRAILAARTQTRRRAMRAWLQSTSSSPPTYDTFERLLRETEVQEDDMRELLRSMCHGKDLEDVPPYTVLDIMTPLAGLATQPVPLPHFLRLKAPLPATKAPRPDFHDLFVSRLNCDEQLLRQLIQCAQPSDGTLDGLLRLLEEHGDDARELLAALCATQRASSDSLGQLLASTIPGESTPSLRAFDIHRLAGQGLRQPHHDHFLSLRFIAEQMLSYLQRREAIRSLNGLTARAESRGEGNKDCTAKQAAFRGGKGSEECYEDFALFFFGDRVQIREYLDLLSLFVWAELQAQDRRTALDGTIYGPTPHRKLLPLNSTRHLSARISHILRALGFGSAPKHQQKDFANSWLHASLLCPTQRLTSEFTLSTIACCIMRRLGVPAQPNDMPFRTFCFAVEQTPQPDGWAGENCNKVWEYFYCDVHDVESRLVAEPDEVQKLLFSMCCFEKAYLSPTPPKNIALRLVGELIGSVERGTTVTTLGETMSAEESRPVRIHGDAPPPQGPLAEFRQYLEGRPTDLSEELPPPTLASLLASLPAAATLNAPRLEPMHRRSEVELAAYWYLAAVDPYQFGGPRKAEEKLCTLLAPWIAEGLDHLLDPFLMVETSNAPSPALRRLKHTLVAKDKVGSEAIGGYGGGNDVKKGRAHWSEEEKKQRLDRKAWPEVKFGVGTLFKHRKTGKAAVAVGWDSERRNAKELREGIEVDTAPYGPTQPHYHAIDEDGVMRYVAQANVLPITILPGSSPEEAAKQLESFVKLLEVGKIGRCFRTLRIEGAEYAKEGEEEERRAVLVMNEWMKEAWPFD